MSVSLNSIPVNEFLRIGISVPVADVRSPGEYNLGHIPGAVNIPLFNDMQRAVVGTIYTHQGHADAAIAGVGLIAQEMPEKMKSAMSLAVKGEILLYCWRGGMRSESMAWLLSVTGIKPTLLLGGYKAYRNFILTDLDKKRNLIVIGGLTGSGKTNILKALSVSGQQVTDLEAIACHKGSAFGALGQPVQPSTEYFANLLYNDLSEKESENLIWIEDESRNIGTVFMPDFFYKRMQEAPVIAIMMSVETRLPRLIEEYTTFPKETIIASITRITKRLGGDKTKEAIEAIKQDDFATAIRIVLDYYDKAYKYGLSKRREGQVIYIDTDTDDVKINAAKVLEVSEKCR